MKIRFTTSVAAMSRTLTRLLLMALFLAVVPAVRATTTRYVNGVSGSDSNNCTAPQTACRTIGHAISLASSEDTIMVAAATYAENLKIGFNKIGFSLTITGSGADATIIDGGHIDTVVIISVAKVTLSRMTIRNGTGQGFGGGVYASGGTVTINNSTLSGNSSGYTCTHNPRPPNSCYAGGGGVYLQGGTLTINDSTISGNLAAIGLCPGPQPFWGCGATGGGIFSQGRLTINNSTLSDNVVYASCKYCFALGGGMYNGGTFPINYTTALNNTTLSGNAVLLQCWGPCSGRGGGIYNSGTLALNNTTVSGNSRGAVVNTSKATLQNSIIANSTGANCSGTMTSSGYNLSSDNSCNFSNKGDLNNIDPKLGQLGNYGGPTPTILLLSGSPAIDAGNPNGCTDGLGHLLKTDQRGKPRPDKEDKGGCDMGAYESQSD